MVSALALLAWDGRLKALETVGAGTIFFGVNLAAGMMIIAAADALTGWFVSHYILGDVSLLGLSLLQAWCSRGGTALPDRPRNAELSPRRA